MTTERRDFLRQASLLAAGTLVAACADSTEVAVATTTTAAAPTPPAAPPPTTWDMSWVDRVTGTYRTAFDAPEISNGICLHQTRTYLAGFETVYGLTVPDITAVLVIRHHAIAMVLGDALWDNGEFGKEFELRDPVTGKRPTANPFRAWPDGAEYALTRPDGGLDRLIARGVIVLCCDLALNKISGAVADQRDLSREDARALVYANVLPGVIIMPSGIFATTRAQAAGCGVMHAV